MKEKVKEPLNFPRIFASSLLIRRSSNSRALAFRRSDMKVVRPLMVDMLSDEKRLAGPPPPPALRIVVARFSFVDRSSQRKSRTRLSRPL